MAIREIRLLGDEILSKKCREVKEMTPRLVELAYDMIDTMHDAEGVGLAAPQVGVLRRIVVIDLTDIEDEDGNPVDENGPYIMVNPVITFSEGEETADEGCLSYPGKAGAVSRPTHVKVKFLDEHMNEFELEAWDLLARAVCHELDHLEGEMYVDKVVGEIKDVSEEE